MIHDISNSKLKARTGNTNSGGTDITSNAWNHILITFVSYDFLDNIVFNIIVNG